MKGPFVLIYLKSGHGVPGGESLLRREGLKKRLPLAVLPLDTKPASICVGLKQRGKTRAERFHAYGKLLGIGCRWHAALQAAQRSSGIEDLVVR